MIAPMGYPEIQAEVRGRMTVKLEDETAGFWTLQRSEDMQNWQSIRTMQAKGGGRSRMWIQRRTNRRISSIDWSIATR